MNILGPLEYPESWESNCLDVGKISVHFGFADSGWIPMSILTPRNNSLTLSLSYVYDPFPEMVDWLKALADGSFALALSIDEEGITKDLVVRPYQGKFSNYADIEFRVFGDYWDAEAERSTKGTYLLARTTRKQLVSEFTKRLDQWIREDYDPEQWDRYGYEGEGETLAWDLKTLDIEGLKSKVNAIADSA